MNLFNQLVLDAIVKQLPATGSFFLDTFFKRRQRITGVTVGADLVKGSRDAAPFVNPKSKAVPIEKTNYTSQSYITPLIKIKDVTGMEDLDIRRPGESTLAPVSRQERAVELMADVLSNFNERIRRREEAMAVDSLVKGAIHVIGEGVDYTIDFGLKNKETLSGTAKWSATGAKPLDDIERWMLICKRKGFRTPNICVMSREAYGLFVKNESVQKLLDIQNFALAKIAPNMLSENVTYGGVIAQWNLSVYIYDEWIKDDWTGKTPVERPLMPPNTVLLASTTMDTAVYYGELTVTGDNKEIITVESERAAQVWTEQDPAMRFLMLQSRPLPVPREQDTWFVATVN